VVVWTMVFLEISSCSICDDTMRENIIWSETL